VNPWRDTVFGMWSVIAPIDHDGVRASVVPLAGVAVVF
jgi:hypothetical protein